MRKILITLLLIACVAVWAKVFSEPQPRPRKLNERERRESVGRVGRYDK